jgi:hypothetical protein
LLIARFINEYSIQLLQHYHIPVHIDYCLIKDDKIYLAFKKLHTLTKSKDIHVVVVIFPHLIESMTMHDTRMSNLIQKWCNELNWEYLDLTGLYQQYGFAALRVNSNDPIHPNGLGHRIAAEAIMEELKKMTIINSISNSLNKFRK